VVVEEATQDAHDPRAHPEARARLLAHDEVEVAPPELELGILEAVPLLRKGPQRLAEEGQLLDADGGLVLLRAVELARDAEKIPAVDELVEERPDLRVERALLERDLELAGPVLEVGEGELAEGADGDEAPGDPQSLRAGLDGGGLRSRSRASFWRRMARRSPDIKSGVLYRIWARSYFLVFAGPETALA
jgi:hypothetical protein